MNGRNGMKEDKQYRKGGERKKRPNGLVYMDGYRLGEPMFLFGIGALFSCRDIKVKELTVTIN